MRGPHIQLCLEGMVVGVRNIPQKVTDTLERERTQSGSETLARSKVCRARQMVCLADGHRPRVAKTKTKVVRGRSVICEILRIELVRPVTASITCVRDEEVTLRSNV